VAALTLAVGAALAVSPPALGAGRGRLPVSVDASVQVTTSPAAARADIVPAVAVDPLNRQVLAVGEADALTGRCTVHISTDAGLSWTAANPPTAPSDFPNCAFVPFGPIVDVTFGPDGTLFYAFSGYNATTFHGRVFLSRSSDLGVTWDTTTLPWVAPDLSQGEAGIDAVPSVAVDAHNPKAVYVGWGSNWATYTLSSAALQGKKYYSDVVERVYVAASGDGGRTFGPAVNVGAGLRLDAAQEGVKPPPQVVVGNHGQVYAVFGEYARPDSPTSKVSPPAHIYLAVSRDGGKTYTNTAIYTQPTPTMSSDWTWVPRVAVDRGTDDLYVVWEHMSASGNPVQISVIRSTNNGKSWGAETKVNDAAPQRMWNYPEAYPSIAVAPDGRVDVVWYDYRNDPTFVPGAKNNAFMDVYYTYSTDRGATWAPNVRITDRLIDNRIGVSNLGGIRGPVGLASTDAAAFVAWTDNRNGEPLGQAEDIYFARARTEKPSSLFPAPAKNNRWWAWALGGVAAGLGLAGLVLLVFLSSTRVRPPTP
jgi:hypothetical protein